MARSDERYRAWVVEQLQPLLPKRWELSEYTRAPQAVTVPTVLVTLQSLQRLPEAPLGNQIVTYLVTVIDPSTDPAQADANLDDEIVDVVNALDSVRNEHGLPVLRWTSATRASYADTYLAFDVTVEVIVSSTNKE